MTLSIPGITTGTISSPGVGSGLDVNSIVSQLVAVEKQPLAALQLREAAYATQISALGSIKGALANLQSTVQSLSTVSAFQKFSATPVDATIFTATASSGASIGTHSIDVQVLAQAQKLASSPFATTDTTVGTGTLTFQFGTYNAGTNSFTLNANKAAKSVVIGAGNQTLAGIRDAVNAAGVGVTASIINDGTGNRLVFASTDSGASNSIKVSVADADGNNIDMNGLSQLAYDPTATLGTGKNLSETVAAKDATVVIDGITITKSSNVISDALQGVTLTLQKQGAGVTTLTVAQNTAAIQSAAQSFVTSFNALASSISTFTAYDPKTRQAGALLGDAAVNSVQNSLRATLNHPVALGNGTTATLSDIGITFQTDGTLALDGTKFQNALTANPDRVGRVFAATGTASDSLVSYVGSTSKTVTGTYSLNISQLATQGTLTGSAAPGLTITAGSNDTFGLTLDGVTATVKINAGVYATAAALAAEVQSEINGVTAFSTVSSSVTVGVVGGKLQITSARYGSASNASVAASAGALNLFGSAPASTVGVDVAGSFAGVVGVGSGQTLTGATGSNSEGLQFQIRGGSTGTRGSVNFSQGYAYQLNQVLTNLLGSGGAIAADTDGINANIKDLRARENRVNQQAVAAEARYRAQFTALDTLIASMNKTSQFLTQQLANLPKTSG